MIWFALSIPILTIIILLIFFRQHVAYWEYFIVILPSALLILALNYIMISYRTTDTEYLGNYIVAAKYYEDWDEWITKTCSYETCTGSGKDRHCTTHYYDCSYRKYHPEYWTMVPSSGYEIEIGKDYYNYLVNKFATETYFVDMDRNYYHDDGDMYETDWSGSIPSAHSVTYSHDYENKIKASHSIFKIDDLKPEEVKQWKLYDYPEIKGYSMDYLLGYQQDEFEQNKIHYLNGYVAKKHQIQTFILIFKNQSKTAAFKQRSHWEGGNKNEFFICIGIDSLTNEIQWSKSFSWMDVPELAVDVDSYISSQKKLNMSSILDFLLQKEPSEWKRKSFKDFDYIKVEVSSTQLTWVIILTLILNIVISAWVIMNEYSHENPSGEYKSRW